MSSQAVKKIKFPEYIEISCYPSIYFRPIKFRDQICKLTFLHLASFQYYIYVFSEGDLSFFFIHMRGESNLWGSKLKPNFFTMAFCLKGKAMVMGLLVL